MGAFYLISGNDDFAVKERAGELIRQLCGDIPEDNADLETIQGDVENERYSSILDKLMGSLETPAFFSAKKTVWLKHFAQFDEALSEPSTKKKASRIDVLSHYLKQGIPPDITLIVDGAGLDRRKAFFKLCEKAVADSGGKLEWFDKTDPKAKNGTTILVRKVKEMAMAAGKRMDEPAASYIAETIGGDTAQLRNELGKLCAYTGNEPLIRLEDCYEICSRNSDTLAWEFSSALAERDAAKALSLIPGIIENLEQERGVSSRPEMTIVAAAHSEFKRIIAVKCEGEKFHIPARADYSFFTRLFTDNKEANPGNPLFAMHPFKAYKTWQNASRFTGRELAQVFNAIFKANKGMVTGDDPRIALELLVTRVSGLK